MHATVGEPARRSISGERTGLQLTGCGSLASGAVVVIASMACGSFVSEVPDRKDST
jgi:hypothetical protein